MSQEASMQINAKLVMLWHELVTMGGRGSDISGAILKILCTIPFLAEQAADWLLMQPEVTNDALQKISKHAPSRRLFATIHLIQREEFEWKLFSMLKEFPECRDLIAARAMDLINYKLGYVSEFVQLFPEYATALYERIRQEDAAHNALYNHVVNNGPFAEQAWNEIHDREFSDKELITLARCKNKAISFASLKRLRKLPETTSIFYFLTMDCGDRIANEVAGKRLKQKDVSARDLAMIVKHVRAKRVQAWELLVSRPDAAQEIENVFSGLTAAVSICGPKRKEPVKNFIPHIVAAGEYLLSSKVSIDNPTTLKMAKEVYNRLTWWSDDKLLAYPEIRELALRAAHILLANKSELPGEYDLYKFATEMLEKFPEIRHEVWALLQKCKLENFQLDTIAKAAPELAPEVRSCKTRDAATILEDIQLVVAA